MYFFILDFQMRFCLKRKFYSFQTNKQTKNPCFSDHSCSSFLHLLLLESRRLVGLASRPRTVTSFPQLASLSALSLHTQLQYFPVISQSLNPLLGLPQISSEVSGNILELDFWRMLFKKSAPWNACLLVYRKNGAEQDRAHIQEGDFPISGWTAPSMKSNIFPPAYLLYDEHGIFLSLKFLFLSNQDLQKISTHRQPSCQHL